MNDGEMKISGAGRLRYHLLVVFVASVTMMPRLWEGDLHRDEVLYAAIAKGIALGGDWINLFIGSDHYWRKPPLMFWLAAGMFKTFGVSVFAAKFFPALFGVLACLALYVLARQLFDDRVALIAAVVLATTPRFVRTAATFRLDSAVTLFTLLALLAYIGAVRDGRQTRFAAAGASWGMAVMAKGAFGLIAPYVFLIYLAVHRRLGAVFSRGFLLSLVVAAAVFLPWHVYETAHWGSPFLDTYLRREVYDRMTGRLWPGYDQGSYLWALLKDAWPWIAFMVAGAIHAGRRARQGDRQALFVLSWAAGYVLLLYASHGRRPRYLLQLYPAASIVAALAIERLLPAHRAPSLPKLIGAPFAAVGFALLVLPIPIHSHAARELKELRPVLKMIGADAAAPLVGFRTPGLQIRALSIFYLDRDLHTKRGAEILDDPSATVLTFAKYVPRLVRRGFVVLYENDEYGLLRPPPSTKHVGAGLFSRIAAGPPGIPPLPRGTGRAGFRAERRSLTLPGTTP